MFTGIVLGQGTVQNLQSRGEELRLIIQAAFDLPNIVIGESIAVNGTCLTVESGANNRFSAFASGETTRCSNVGQLRIGSTVNLERALALGDRLGGHLVSGHVDTIATVSSLSEAGSSHTVRLTFDPAHAREILPKGSVTLDGVSLTVNDCGQDFLEVNVIPETWKTTTMPSWRAGSKVNLETDMVGKYILHLMAPYMPGKAPAGGQVTMELLQKNGFI